MFTQPKKFLRFRHAAIRRYGDKRWTAIDGYIEFNPNYTVSISTCEKEIVGDAGDCPYIVELSNGTKFLCFMHDYGQDPDDELLSCKGEEANRKTGEYSYTEVAENIRILNRSENGTAKR